MKRVLSLAFVLTLVCTAASSQSQKSQSFADFRKEMLEGYNKFRQSILDDYDRFLEAAWGDYEQFRGKDRYEVPKPHVAPTAPVGGDTTVDRPLPSPVKAEPQPAADPSGKVGFKPAAKPDARPAAKPEPTPAAAPSADYTFPFYNIEFKIAENAVSLPRRLSSSNDFADQWRALAKSDVKQMIPEFKRIAADHGFNDYLTFRLIRAYVDSRYASSHPTARVALEHYLLANMGFDVRIAVDDRGTPLLLIPFSQHVYGRPFLMFDRDKYYVFQPEGVELNTNSRISTCKLPADADLGRPMDLRLSALRLPAKMKDFNLAYGGIELHGQVNENIFPIIYQYPQMAIGDYAESAITPELRADLVSQLKTQLQGLSQAEAVDKLLKFTQSAFEYATDGDFHGFEKPYFLEEILFYPKCDCEDRAIFYTYMLWNVLGVRNHLIAYPGHESASVCLDEPIKGTSYDYEGDRFYISDPTFIGASSGMCMPAYTSTQPEIDYVYK